MGVLFDYVILVTTVADWHMLIAMHIEHGVLSFD